MRERSSVVDCELFSAVHSLARTRRQTWAPPSGEEALAVLPRWVCFYRQSCEGRRNSQISIPKEPRCRVFGKSRRILRRKISRSICDPDPRRLHRIRLPANLPIVDPCDCSCTRCRSICRLPNGSAQVHHRSRRPVRRTSCQKPKYDRQVVEIVSYLAKPSLHPFRYST